MRLNCVCIFQAYYQGFKRTSWGKLRSGSGNFFDFCFSHLLPMNSLRWGIYDQSRASNWPRVIRRSHPGKICKTYQGVVRPARNFTRSGVKIRRTSPETPKRCVIFPRSIFVLCRCFVSIWLLHLSSNSQLTFFKCSFESEKNDDWFRVGRFTEKSDPCDTVPTLLDSKVRRVCVV